MTTAEMVRQEILRVLSKGKKALPLWQIAEKISDDVFCEYAKKKNSYCSNCIHKLISEGKIMREGKAKNYRYYICDAAGDIPDDIPAQPVDWMGLNSIFSAIRQKKPVSEYAEIMEKFRYGHEKEVQKQHRKKLSLIFKCWSSGMKSEKEILEHINSTDKGRELGLSEFSIRSILSSYSFGL